MEASTATPEEKNTKLRIISAILSSIIPGSGQYLLGRRRAGVIFLCLFLFAGILFWPVRIPASWLGIQVVVIASLSLFTLVGWHALRCESKEANRASYWWLILIIPLSVAAALAHCTWWIRAAGFKPFLVPSSAMEPTIRHGEHVVVDLRRYQSARPKDGELVVYELQGTFYVKRLIASRGETVESRSGQLFVNGVRLDEPYAQHTGESGFPWMNNFDSKKIPAGKLFVVGDNRDLSYDSRMPEHGLVDENELTGQAIYVFRSSLGSREGFDLRLHSTSQ